MQGRNPKACLDGEGVFRCKYIQGKTLGKLLQMIHLKSACIHISLRSHIMALYCVHIILLVSDV